MVCAHHTQLTISTPYHHHHTPTPYTHSHIPHGPIPTQYPTILLILTLHTCLANCISTYVSLWYACTLISCILFMRCELIMLMQLLCASCNSYTLWVRLVMRSSTFGCESTPHMDKILLLNLHRARKCFAHRGSLVWTPKCSRLNHTFEHTYPYEETMQTHVRVACTTLCM